MGIRNHMLIGLVSTMNHSLTFTKSLSSYPNIYYIFCTFTIFESNLATSLYQYLIFSNSNNNFFLHMNVYVSIAASTLAHIYSTQFVL